LRVARRLDPVALTFVEMLAACAAFSAIAAARSDFETPRGWTVWGALLVTGVFASALGFLVQTWAQRRTSATRTALAFALEPVWTALFGFTLAGDRLGGLGWGGCAAILGAIVLTEPAAARALRRLVVGA
jgi:drug/metabolite transporter (DMT)-like permease